MSDPSGAAPPARPAAGHGRGERIGIFAGTFDPMTFGHLDIVRRACRLTDRLVVAVASNAGKGPLFSHEERVALVRDEIEAIADELECPVVVQGFDGLLVELARTIGARVFFRGLRAVADFDYEVQMFGMNSRLDPTIDTVFLVSNEQYRSVASRLVKEVARLGGDIAGFVPARTLERTLARLR